MSSFVDIFADASSQSGSSSAHVRDGVLQKWTDKNWDRLTTKIKTLFPTVVIGETKASSQVKHVVLLPESTTMQDTRANNKDIQTIVDVLGGHHLCVQLYTSTGESPAWSSYTGYVFLGLWYHFDRLIADKTYNERYFTISISAVNNKLYVQKFTIGDTAPGLDVKK